MSDSTSYINTYLEHSISMIHEYTNQILQLRTQAKLATDLVKQKDEVIAGLQQELDNCKSESTDWHKNADSFGDELNQKKDEFKRLEDECNALRGKVSHMETLASQLTNANHELTKKVEEVRVLNENLINKSNQVEDLSKQLEGVKQELVNKNTEINDLSSKVTYLETELSKKPNGISPQKQINTKGKSTKVDKTQVDETDDF